MTNDDIVSVNGVSKIFGTGDTQHIVIDDVTFGVRKGEFLSVMGPSGCGKSTLLYLMGGLETPTSGEIITCGHNFAKMSDKEQSRVRCQHVGFVFQFYNLVQNLTVEENILLPVIMAGKPVDKYKKRAEYVLDMMGIADKRNEIPSKLSGGQQQRASIARAVIMNPLLILADEPTGNLDSKSGIEVMKNFRAINKEYGISIIMVTHSDDAASFSDRIIRMKDGKIYDSVDAIGKDKEDGNSGDTASAGDGSLIETFSHIEY